VIARSLPKKIIVGVAVYLTLLLALFILENGFPLHRREFDRADIAWLNNPNPQTESLLHAQSRKNLIISIEDSAEAALLFWVVGFGCYEVVRYLRRTLRQPHRQIGTRIMSK
jgi:hypothetical protein